MKHVARVLILIAVILAGSVSVSSAVTFRIENAAPRQADDMRLILEVAALRLEKLLEVHLPDTVTVILVQTQEEFDSLAKGRIPEWGAGAAIAPRNLILLREPMIGRYPGSLANLLQHELAHIALYHRVQGRRLPRFIDEGFASWFAGEWSFSNITTVAAAQITNSLLPLRDIDDVNTFHAGKANLAYSQSYLVVFYLFQRFGELAFLELLDAFTEGKNVSMAFHYALGISFWRFEAEYRKFLADNYTLLNILADMSSLWIILAIVVVIGFIILRKRRKDALDRWRDEERYESTDFDWSGSDDEPWKDPDDSARV